MNDPSCPRGGAAIASAGGTVYVCSATAPQQPLVDAAAIATINGWAGLPTDASWTLCFKGTRDAAGGFFSSAPNAAFHSRCDNRGRSFFVALTSAGKLIGGFTSLPWGAAACTYKGDPSAFLFSLTNAYKHAQIAGGAYAQYAVLDCSSYGPSFGGGNDFQTNLKDSAGSALGYTYACRVGTRASSDCVSDFVGGAPLLLVDLEVYTER